MAKCDLILKSKDGLFNIFNFKCRFNIYWWMSNGCPKHWSGGARGPPATLSQAGCGSLQGDMRACGERDTWASLVSWEPSGHIQIMPRAPNATTGNAEISPHSLWTMS